MGQAAIDGQRRREGPIFDTPDDCGAGVESQRAMIAAKMANMRSGERTDLTQNCGRSISQEDAAALLNVSTRTVQHAKSVQEHGTRELVKAVKGNIRNLISGIPNTRIRLT